MMWQMRRDLPLTPWPRLRETWWVYALAVTLVGLYSVALMERLRCRFAGRCGGAVAHVLDLEAVGGLPRLVTTALFVVTAVIAWGACLRSSGLRALWWAAVGVVAAALSVLKLVSAHSVAKADSVVLTLLGSVLVTVVVLGALVALGRRWGVPAAGPVVLALAVYACAALGLDVVTWAVAAVQSHAGALSAAATAFVEELGEALTALTLLVTVRWQGAMSTETRADDSPPGS